MDVARVTRHWKAAGIVLGAIALLVGIALSAVGWYYAGVLHDDALRAGVGEDRFDLVVADVTGDTIGLEPGEGASADGFWTEPGRFGLAWEGGWAYVGDILEMDKDHVVRAFQAGADGAPSVGKPVRLDSFVFPGDPGSALGLAVRDVVIPGALGDMPAWFVDGDPSRVAVLVHGRKAPRREMLRILPVLHEAGFSSLVIAYRNDPDAPASSDGLYRFGAAEWPDLEAAIAFARDHGAQQVVLVGYSMGGAIVLSFMQHSELAVQVDGLILDAPLLSFEEAVDFEADREGIWSPVTAVGKQFASWRFGVNWEEVDYRAFAETLNLPVLLFHGSEDDTTPVALSDDWAAHRPDNVTYLRVEGAGHVRSWNVAPGDYEAAVTNFLSTAVPSQFSAR